MLPLLPGCEEDLGPGKGGLYIKEPEIQSPFVTDNLQL